jgi:hypothetical protein
LLANEVRETRAECVPRYRHVGVRSVEARSRCSTTWTGAPNHTS